MVLLNSIRYSFEQSHRKKKTLTGAQHGSNIYLKTTGAGRLMRNNLKASDWLRWEETRVMEPEQRVDWRAVWSDDSETVSCWGNSQSDIGQSFITCAVCKENAA